jgi:hypothetical protein
VLLGDSTEKHSTVIGSHSMEGEIMNREICFSELTGQDTHNYFMKTARPV